MVEHDPYLKPIITPHYSIYFELTESCDVNLLRELEPYCQLFGSGSRGDRTIYQRRTTKYRLSVG